MRGFAVVAITTTLLALQGGAPAYAQLERAGPAADEGHFEQALTYLNRAMRSDNLSRADMLEALELRVLVYYALHRAQDLQRDLDLLLAIDPATDLGASAPPDLAAAVDERRRHVKPLRISARVQDLPGAVRVEARDVVVAEGYGLRAVVGARSPGGAWQLSYDGQVDHASLGRAIEYFAAVVTSRGVVLVSDGTQEAPKLHRLPPVLAPNVTTAPLAERSDAGSEDRRRVLWWTVGSASVAVVVATTIAVLFVRGRTASGADVEGPEVEYPSAARSLTAVSP